MATAAVLGDDLQPKDLAIVLEALVNVSTRWYELGLELGLNTVDLDGIHNQNCNRTDSYRVCLRMMLSLWLKQKDVQPSWPSLVTALRSDSIKEIVLAKKLEKLYLHSSEPNEAPKLKNVPDRVSPKVKHSSMTDTQQLQVASLDTIIPVGQMSLTDQTTKDDYRFLDVKNLSEDEQHQLKGRLTKEYKEIHSRFARFTESLRLSLSSRDITPKQMFMVLMDLNAFAVRKKDSNKSVLEDCCDDIKDAENIFDVFCLLRPYYSFFDCHVIKHIVESPSLCTNDDRKGLAGYLAELEVFCKRNVFECPHIANCDDQLRTLVMKVHDTIVKTFTIEAIDEFRAKLAEALGLEGHTLLLRSVEKGCLQLTFQIPQFVMSTIFPLSSEEERRLKMLGVLKVTCEGVESNLDSDPIQSHSDQLAMQPRPKPSRGCTKFRLLGECRFGSQCRYGHSDQPILNPSTEYMPIPRETSTAVRHRLVGKIDYSPYSKAFITVESEHNPSDEIKIIAEDDATMAFAKRVVFDEARALQPYKNPHKRECVKYKLLHSCENESCTFTHGDKVESPSTGYVAHPVGRIPTLEKIIGLVGHCSGGSYTVVESDRDKNKEVKIYAENDESLEHAKKAVLVKLGQSHSDQYSSVGATSIALCYIHPEGVETIGLQLKLEPWLEKGKWQYKLQKADTKFGARPLKVENYLDLNKQLPNTVYYILDNPEKIRELKVLSSYTAQVRLLKDYQDQIHQQLRDALKWMYDQGLHPKLEGRFGKIRWGKMPNFLLRESFDVNRFVNFIFKNHKYMRFFRPQLEKANVLQAIEGLTDTGSVVETYDMKIAVENKGKLDIRLQFVDGMAEVLAVKKDEEKLLLCDILSLHRKHDARLSLNNYQSHSAEDPTVVEFVKTVHSPEPNTLEFVAQDSNNEWTARMVRHKRRYAYFIGPNKKYVITFSCVNSYEVTATDLAAGIKHTVITIKPDDWKEHYELELHNMSWEVAFGHQFGNTPQQSLSLLLAPEKIPSEILASTPQRWNPDSIMADFVGDRFLQMLDDVNKSITV